MRFRAGLKPFGVVLIVFALVVAACSDDDGGTTEATEGTTATTAAETTTTTAATEPEGRVVEVPFLAQWEGSGHNDAEAEAFVHWDEDGAVSADCAKCHSTPGMLDFLGADGSAFGSVEADAALGTTVECVACHNDVTISLTSVMMPSGIELTGLGDESRCMNCHQGRESGVSVEEMITAAGVDDDTVSEEIGFLNIHYFAAAATRYGNEAHGGYQYEGQTYDSFFAHVEGYSACMECHDPHTLELKIEECATCHVGVASAEDLKNVRMPGSLVDFDGDGDLAEGIYYEIEGLQGLLAEAMTRYAAEFTGNGIVYNDAAYPYFFNDLNGNGMADEDESNRDNRYATWTPRLAKAAYNYQMSLKDPGAFAHGGKYIIQLLVDSINDLNSVLADPVAVEAVRRIDHGHFAGSEEAFRHWDEDEPAVVPASCSKCHSAAGLPLFLAEGVTISQEPANGFLCSTCHNDLSAWTRYEPASVVFPSGAEVDSGSPDGNLCMNCHQGRESTVSVNARIGDTPGDTVIEGGRFVNVHYFPAGATLFGTEVQGGFEYEGKTYAGRFAHVEGFDTCTECHGAHTLEVKVEACAGCHGGSEDPHTYRMTQADVDGDGDVAEGMYGEIDTLRADLYAAMQAYAEANGLGAFTYDPNSYPYFFGAEGSFANWTPNLLRAAYNYQYATKDPGGFAHNGAYVAQLVIDSIEALGGDVTKYTRP